MEGSWGGQDKANPGFIVARLIRIVSRVAD